MVDMKNPHYGGFWIRFVAALLDTIIIGVPVFILQLGLVWLTDIMAMQYVVSLASAIFYVYCMGSLGGTPGKLILGLRIVDEKGEYIGIPKAILRYIGYFISAIILLIGYFMIAWDKKKQGLHDKIAKSYVVYKN